MKVLAGAIVVMTLLTFFKANAYDHKNQAIWYHLANAECHLYRQSPIELSSNEASLCYGMSPIYFHNFHVPYKAPAIFLNNGNTAELQLSKSNTASISGGPMFNNTFVSEFIHFHWGSRDTHGSEHVVDNRRYSMEMHIVHRNSKYKSIDKAARHKDGLAVLAIFYDVKTSLQTDFVGLNKIVAALANIKAFNRSTKVHNLKLSDLFLGINTADFFAYEGSLTTPPCSEAVTWIVLRQIINITANQTSPFRLLCDKHDQPLENNYRGLQAKGLRPVCHYYSPLP